MNAAVIEEPTKDVGEYIDAFRRRRGTILAISAIIFCLGSIVAFVWPPTYRSAATILIEEQEVPSELVQSTVTSYALQRIEEIKQRVMTRNKMMEIVEKYNLYPDERRRETTEQVIGRMRDDISVNPISAEVMDPRSGRPGIATIAFTLAYRGETASKVQKVASEITTMYLQENLQTRTSKASETYKFLSDEAQRLSDEISLLEAKLATFKETNVHSLPELQQLNTSLMERTERAVDETKNQIRALEDRKIYLEGQLTLIDPHGENVLTSPSARLKALRTEYIALLAKYSDSHPDTMRLKREIEALERETGQIDISSAILEQLAMLGTELTTARERYSDEHPDVVRLTQAIDRLEQDLQASEANTDTPARESTPDNPAYVTLQSQLNQTVGEIQSLHTKVGQLEEKLADLESRLVETPQVEREYRALNRDYENAVIKYQEIKAKQLQAQVAQQLEAESKGERFTLIDPAALPEEPISPNRPAIIFLSLVLAIGSGIGFAAIGESMDSTVRGVKGVLASVQVAPLSVIPYMANDGEVAKNKQKTAIMIGSAIIGLVAVLLLAHIFWTPLDVLWFKALRRASIETGIDFE